MESDYEELVIAFGPYLGLLPPCFPNSQCSNPPYSSLKITFSDDLQLQIIYGKQKTWMIESLSSDISKVALSIAENEPAIVTKMIL